MKVKAAMFNRRSYGAENKKTDKNTLTAFLSIGFGIISGCILYVFSNELDISSLGELFVSFSDEFSSKQSIEILTGLIIKEIPFILLILLFGTSLIGKGFICFLSALKGSGLGFLSSFLYCTYGLKGLEYCLLVFYPGKIVLLFSLILASKNALTCSRRLKNGSEVKENIINDYIVSCIIVLIVSLTSCLIDYILLVSFSSLFSF